MTGLKRWDKINPDFIMDSTNFWSEVIILYLFSFWSCYTECGILVSRSWVKPLLPAVEARSLNHWMAREVLVSPCSQSTCLFPLRAPTKVQQTCLFPLRAPHKGAADMSVSPACPHRGAADMSVSPACPPQRCSRQVGLHFTLSVSYTLLEFQLGLLKQIRYSWIFLWNQKRICCVLLCESIFTFISLSDFYAVLWPILWPFRKLWPRKWRRRFSQGFSLLSFTCKLVCFFLVLNSDCCFDTSAPRVQNDLVLLWKAVCQFFKELNIELTIWPSNSTPR